MGAAPVFGAFVRRAWSEELMQGKIDIANGGAWRDTAALEQKITVIWRSVLNREQVARDENFFAIGGDSILAIRVIARMRKEGMSVSPPQLVQHPTIAALVLLLCVQVEADVDTEERIV